MTKHQFFFAKVEFFIVGLICSAIVFGDSTTFDVCDFGAVGDGVTDDTEAFLQAWNATCRTETQNAIMVVPENNTFLVYQISFIGPCIAKNIIFLVEGNIIAPDSPEAWSGLNQGQWIVFVHAENLHLTGSGTFEGHGSGWWAQSCRYHPQVKGCTRLAPTAVKFISCKSISISNISFLNSPQAHISIIGCRYMSIYNLVIESPGDSPNTDGIHIQSSQDVAITRTVIRSGDDCISIGDYTSNIDISYIVCGPGHGVSIGSLGRSGNFVRVENIRVSNIYFSYTTNGARIKTWQIGKGYVRRILFEDIRFYSVKNPIIIDQNYCEVRGACPETLTGVAISNVTYRNMFGTSKTEVAINLNCSRSVACTGIVLDSVKILSTDSGGRGVSSSCTNAFGTARGVQPRACLQNLKSARITKAALQYIYP